MSRPQTLYAILRDGYPYGISTSKRHLRLYHRKTDAERSAQDLSDADIKYRRGDHTYEVAQVLFGINTEGVDAA